MTFVLAFLGSLFALLVVVALVWTYAVLSVLPRLAKWYGEEMAKATGTGQFPVQLPPGYEPPSAAMIVHTCEVHGRCNGCPWVLGHMEAVANVPGFELNDLEMDELARLRRMSGGEPEHEPEPLDMDAAQALEPIMIGKTQLTRSQARTLFASVSVFIADLMNDPRAAPQAHLRNAREIEKLIVDEVIRPGLPRSAPELEAPPS